MDLLLVFLFLLLTAFFNGGETGLISLDRIYLHNNLEKGKLSAKLLAHLYRNSEDVIGTFLIGTNISDVSIVIFFTRFIQNYINNNSLIVLVNTLFLTPLVLIFGTLIPKVIFRELADKILYVLSFLYFLFYYLFYPVQFILMKIIKYALSLLGIKKNKGIFSKEEFNYLLEITETKGVLKESEKEIIENILNFKSVKTKEVMVPLVRLTCVEENDSVEIASALMQTTKHTRLPVFRMRVDNMVGYVENKDILFAKRDEKVKAYVKEAIYVPDIVPVYNVLQEMKNKKVQMAFAIDEYGGVSGILTNQDIVSEFLGDFVDIHTTWFKKEGDSYIVSGMFGIDELNEELNLNLVKTDFDTVAGFMINKLQRIPVVGDVVYYKKYKFEVISATQTRVTRIKITPYNKKLMKNNQVHL